MITPYYSADGLTVYHARFEDVLAAGLVPVPEVALIHDDPAYGVEEATDRAARGRGAKKKDPRFKTVKARDFDPVEGDDKPFDPTLLLSLKRPTVIWGGHLCQPALPRSCSWLFWGKRNGTTPDDNGDGELAWSNLGGPIREFQHLWRGTCRASETGTIHLHPTQKPIALCTWVYQRAQLQPGDLVFVPHLGSGPDLPAARAMGLRVIGCDVEEKYCRIAVARLGAAPHPEPVTKLGPLFGPRRVQASAEEIAP